MFGRARFDSPLPAAGSSVATRKVARRHLGGVTGRLFVTITGAWPDPVYFPLPPSVLISLLLAACRDGCDQERPTGCAKVAPPPPPLPVDSLLISLSLSLRREVVGAGQRTPPVVRASREEEKGLRPLL